MRNLYIGAFILIGVLTSCSKEDITPDTPTPPVPAVDRKLSFHCNIHNLNYRFSEYTDDKYKALVMPCPICKVDSATAFMNKNQFATIQLLCPVDSTWNNFVIATSDKNYLLRDKKPFVSIANYDGFKTYTVDQLKIFALNKDFTRFPDCWCQTCYTKARLAAIKVKEDSIQAFRTNINNIIGMKFTSYPVNTGVPPDRRARALQILDSIEAIMPQLDSDYKREYSSINGFLGLFNYNRQRYIYSRKTGTPLNSYVSKDIAFSKVCADEYIGDTVIISIGGGPDYSLDGVGLPIRFYKTKSEYSIQNAKRKTGGTLNLTNSSKIRVRTKSSRSKANASYQLQTDFYPGNVDFLPSQYLPRKYNTFTTSVFSIFHPQKGNELGERSSMYTWNFIDMAKSVGGWNQTYPNNIATAYTAEVANDLGTMEIRKVVEWCKARGKHIVLAGTSWGGAMIMNYLLYYSPADFDQIIIADQNPNIPASILEGYMEKYIYGGVALQYGTDPSYKQINLNLCLITADTYRRMEWLKKLNLNNVTFYFAETDDTVGVIPTEDVSTLKSLGAKVFRFPSPITHGVFHDYRAWYRYITPTQM